MHSVYTLADPVDNIVRYVGYTASTLKHRLGQHLCDRNVCHRTCWIQSVLTSKRVPIIQLLETVDSLELAIEAECFYMAYLRYVGFDLVNIAPGGSGSPMLGRKHSSEAKQKISAARLGRRLSTAHRQHIADSSVSSRAVNQYTRDGQYLATFDSITLAERHLSFKSPGKSNISRVCSSERRTAGGFVWKYVDDSV